MARNAKRDFSGAKTLMSKGIQKYEELDPELAAFYKPASEAPKVHEPTVEKKPTESEEDPLLLLKQMAEEQEANSRNRKELEPGFDTVENDLSNVVSVGWKFLTRPL
jgi:hypothetical protein